MEKICTNFVKKLLSYANYPQENDAIEIYTYGLLSFLYTLIPSFILISFSCCIGHPYEMLIWMFCFLTLRKYAGGIHAKTPIKCFILSILLGLSALFLCQHPTTLQPCAYFACNIFNLILLTILAPATIKDFTNKQRFICKIKLLLFILANAIIFYFFTNMQNYYLHALWSTTLLCIAQKLQK